MREFWMVWKEGCGAPTYQHWDEASARAEAERLAVGTIGGARYYVLRAIGSCVRQTVVWEQPEKPHAAGCDCSTCIPF